MIAKSPYGGNIVSLDIGKRRRKGSPFNYERGDQLSKLPRSLGALYIDEKYELTPVQCWCFGRYISF